MTAPAVVTSRRISAGIRPDPGSTSRLPAWWGREDWLTYDVPVALDLHPDVLRAHHVSRDACLEVARGMAAYADHRTGRDCRPGNDRLVESLHYSRSTMHRARRAMKALGLVAVVGYGRSFMTRAERLAAHARGSSHRQVAAVFALCSRPRRAPKMRASQRGMRTSLGCAPSHPVDRDTPPGAAKGSGYLSLGSTHLRRRTDNEERRSARDGRPRRLAETVRDRLPWLRGQSWRRLAPALTKCARAGWTVRDVELAVREVLAIRGHRVPPDLRHPAAYLAGVLRDVDTDGVRPSIEQDAHEAWLREQAAAERAGRRARVLELAGKCAHGVPAHGAGQPARGVAPCPACQPHSTS